MYSLFSGCRIESYQDMKVPIGGNIGYYYGLQLCKDMCMADTNCYAFNYLESGSGCGLKPMSMKGSDLVTESGIWFYYKIDCDTTTSSVGKFFL